MSLEASYCCALEWNIWKSHNIHADIFHLERMHSLKPSRHNLKISIHHLREFLGL